MKHRPAVTVASGLVLLVAGCSGGPGGAAPGTSSGTTAPAAGVVTGTAPSSPSPSSPGSDAGTSAGPSSSGTVPASGPALAEAISAAATGMYTVRATVTGEYGVKASGRGFLRDRTLAVHDTGGDAPMDVEVVGSKAYTSLADVTTGRQRVLVDLADPTDQLRETVLPVVAATDLARVVAAVRSASAVRSSGREVVATVPGRSLASLVGSQVDGALPSSGPVRLTLDDKGRPVSVTVRVGDRTRRSTYGGWGDGAPITAPPAKDIVDSPL